MHKLILIFNAMLATSAAQAGYYNQPQIYDSQEDQLRRVERQNQEILDNQRYQQLQQQRNCRPIQLRNGIVTTQCDFN